MNEPAKRSNKGLLIGAGALVIAAVGVVGFVLPAEFGIDPTGIGKATGVLAMAEPAENIYLKRGQARKDTLFALEGAIAPEAQAAKLAEVLQANGKPAPAADTLKQDRYTFELAPFEGIEMKYELAQGSPLIFSWSGSGPLDIDMHSHPYEGGTAATESFVIEKLPRQAGVYIAPFTGIHGWYWQNRTMQPVTLTLDATGVITKSMTFSPSGEAERPLVPPPPPVLTGDAAPPPAPATPSAG